MSAPRAAMIGSFALALLLRVAWVLVAPPPEASAVPPPTGTSADHAAPALYYPDEQLHWQLADNLLHHGILASADRQYAARMPLYPALLAPFTAAGPDGAAAARLLQALLGAATALLAARLGGRLAGVRGAWLAGLLVAVDPFAIFFTNLLLTETIFSLLLVATVSAACSAVQTVRPAPVTVLALAAGSAALLMTRPSVAALLPILWLLAAYGATGSAGAVRLLSWRGLRCMTASAAACALALALWGGRNLAVLGSPAWLSTNGGITLYDAQGPQARGDSDQSFLKKMPAVAALPEVERDRELGRLAREQMLRDPARVAQLALVKLARTWNPFPNVAEHRAERSAWAGAIYTLTLLALAIVGAVRLRRTGAWRLMALLLAPVLYFTLVHMIYVGSVRYRVPVMPLLAVVGCAAISPRGPLPPACPPAAT
ncbi:MAG: glycosyltransferase family 39 protein [Phycisphaerales bacterium]|nr:glycosyltransferase family 39 protein [Phycisphaerales bacterium]